MNIIDPSVELVDEIDSVGILQKIERCGRVCYQSQPKEGETANFVRMLIKRGHESVLEHVSLTFHIICDRAIMSELTRHRLCAFSVESTRYVKHSELSFINPFKNDIVADMLFERMATTAEDCYFDWLAHGAKPEEVRAALPLCLKSELYMTANLREWRHILKLRTSIKAHPQMRAVAGLILSVLKDKLPVIVEDIQ